MNTTLIPAIERLANNPVLVVGDVMLDRYVYGQVDRISPEAPIPVIHVQREAAMLGGAGNVVRNLVALGGAVNLVAAVGDDQSGRDLVKLFSELPKTTSNLFTDTARPTTVKMRYVANGQQLLRADNELAQALSPAMDKDAISRVQGSVKTTKVIILSDYAKGVLTPNVIAETIKLAQTNNCMVLVDPKNRDFGRYRGAYMLTPNRKELSEAYGSTIRSVEDAEKAARHMIATHNFAGILAKLGADGVCLVMKDQPAQHFQTLAREVFDVSGAGDTVVATLALSLAGGLTPAQSAELANIAGSIVVGKVGTATVSADELIHELRHNRASPNEQKIMTSSEVQEVAERWRKQGHKVGFTNGVFDLLHPGHISLLRQARAACDKLVVGLNSDASVKRLKGDSRPVQNEIARSTVLSSLGDVDAVVVFEDDTPVSLIKTVHPSVLIKGADYTVSTVVGADLVQSWGGTIVLADLVNGQSTTSTLARLESKA